MIFKQESLNLSTNVPKEQLEILQTKYICSKLQILKAYLSNKA